MFWNNFILNGNRFAILSLTFFSFCPITLAESSESDKTAIVSDHKSAKELIMRLWESDAKEIFASHPNAQPFHIEMSLHVSDSKRTPLLNLSEVYEWNGKKPFVIARVNSLVIRFVATDTLHFNLLESGKWYVKTGIDWGVLIDEDSKDLIRSSTGMRVQDKRRIQVEPMSFVSGLAAMKNGGAVNSVFNKAARYLQFQLNNKKGELWLVTRIPSDQLRYGYPLESIWVSKKVDRMKSKEKADLMFSLNSFASGKDSKLLMENPRKLERYETLLPKHTFMKNQSLKGKKFVRAFSTDKHFSSSNQLYQLFADTEFSEDDPQKKQIKKTAAQIHHLREFENKVLQKDEKKQVVSQKELEKECDEAIQVLKQLSLQSYMQKPKQSVAIQDQFMRWKYLEACYGPTEISKFYDGIITTFLLNKKLDKERLYMLSDAIADLGYPRHAANGGKIIGIRQKNLFIDTIFRPRWSINGWIEEIHLKPCLKADGLESNSLAINNIVVETLIRMDATNLVKPKSMRAWFQSEIIQTSGRERIMNLSILSLQPSGRDYLLKRLSKGIADKVLHKEIAKHLNARVDATVQTKRYDFMPQAECNRIKKVIGK